MRHEPERNDSHHSDATDVGSDSQRAHLGFVLVFDLCEVDFRAIPIGIEAILIRPYRRIAVRPERKVVLLLVLVRRFISFGWCSDHRRTLIRSSREDSISLRVCVCGDPTVVPRLSCDIYSIICLPAVELGEQLSPSPGVRDTVFFVHTAHQLMIRLAASGMSRAGASV